MLPSPDNAVLPQTFNLEKMLYLQSVIKQSTVKWGMPAQAVYKTFKLLII